MPPLILRLAAGFALFITGIIFMHASMQEVSGTRLKLIIRSVTDNMFTAILAGCLLTGLVQSSSAVLVITVGLAGAGIIPFDNVFGIIYGSNLGTTVTIQLLSLHPPRLTYLLPLAGLLLILMGRITRSSTARYCGWVLTGFGLLFLGMEIMSGAVVHLRESRVLGLIVLQLSRTRLGGVIFGAVLSAIFQSSSAVTGLIILFVREGLLRPDAALPFVLGCNIGTCSTPLLATIGGGTSARKTACAHLGFNIGGVIIFLLLFGPFLRLVTATAAHPARQLANAHTLFNLLNMIVFLPLTPPFRGLINALFERLE